MMQKKILAIVSIMVATMLTSSCQKELLDSIKNIDVNQGQSAANSEMSLDTSTLEFAAGSESKIINLNNS